MIDPNDSLVLHFAHQLLAEHGFDDFAEAQCASFYAETMGRPGLPPGIYFRLLLIGYFEGIDSECGIAWRPADSLAFRGRQAKKPMILAVLNSGKPGDDLGMANRPRPLVKITRLSPSPGDRYGLRDVHTDQVLASIRVTTLANPLSHVDAICHLAQLAERRRWRLLFR